MPIAAPTIEREEKNNKYDTALLKLCKAVDVFTALDNTYLPPGNATEQAAWTALTNAIVDFEVAVTSGGGLVNTASYLEQLGIPQPAVRALEPIVHRAVLKRLAAALSSAQGEPASLPTYSTHEQIMNIVPDTE